MRLVVQALSLFGLAAGAAVQVFEDSSGAVTIHNGWVSATFNKSEGSLDFGANFLGSSSGSGSGNYKSVLASPLALEVRSARTCHSSASASQSITWEERAGPEGSTEVVFSGMLLDCESSPSSESSPFISSTWTVSMTPTSRSISLSLSGTAVSSGPVTAVSYGMYFVSPSIYGLFSEWSDAAATYVPKGIAQMMNNPDTCLASDTPLTRLYAMGSGAAVDVLYSYENSVGAMDGQIVLLSAGSSGFGSGVQRIVRGKYSGSMIKRMGEAWAECWPQGDGEGAFELSEGDTWTLGMTVVPNDYDFPSLMVQDVESQPQLPFRDIRTFLTGIYGSPVGCMQGYYDGGVGTISPTISAPTNGYSPDTNFFDPDNFFSTSALLYSGDDFLIQEVRKILERTGETMCGLGSDQLKSYCSAPRASKVRGPKNHVGSRRLSSSSGRDGQIMHHFENLIPTYESIAGSEQLGPNIFWSWSVIKFISLTQDWAWGSKMFPYIDLSVKYLLSFYDESKKMINAPGPLWIDVLVREQFTSDSNAVMVAFFETSAEIYETVCLDFSIDTKADPQDCLDFASLLREVSVSIAQSMSVALWDKTDNDHFVTQVDSDGSVRDFVDYDSNLLAVAFGAVEKGTANNGAAARSKAILARVDAGNYTHVRATWCSEILYTGDACDCYIVGGSECGDSVVTLARVGWADAHARRAVGDLKTFDDVLLSPLQDDLIADTWLYERYDSNANQIRTAYYFEYPSLIAMMLREVRYGINVGLAEVRIDPFLAADKKTFIYSFGATRVAYSETYSEIMLPSMTHYNVSPKKLTVRGLRNSADYEIGNTCGGGTTIVTADAAGSVGPFDATFRSGCSVTVSIVQN